MIKEDFTHGHRNLHELHNFECIQKYMFDFSLTTNACENVLRLQEVGKNSI